MEEPRIVQNAVRVKSVDKIYWSRHRHDFIRFETEFGDCMLDGGTEYIRHGISPDNTDVEWLTVYADEPVEEAAKKLVGIRGDEYVMATSLTLSELEEMKARLISRGHPLAVEATEYLIAKISPLLDRILED